MITTRTRFASIGGIALISIATLALVPWKLTAQDADAEAVAKLKEENAKLRQELEAVRRDAEKVRSDAEQMRKRALAERETEEATLKRDADLQGRFARDQARSLERKQRDIETIRAEQQRRMEQVQAELQELRTQFTENHPRVRETQARLEKMEAMRAAFADRNFEDPLESKRDTAAINERAMKRQEEQRALLQKEIELAERHVEYVRKALENGKEIPASQLAAQRELLDAKLQLARLSNSKADQRAVLLQQLNVAENTLKEYRKRVEVGTLSPGAEIPFEREVLRIKRQLASPELEN